MRTLEDINLLHYKNTLIIIWDYITSTRQPIQQITLLQFQQHIGSRIKNLWNASKDKQDDNLVQLNPQRL